MRWWQPLLIVLELYLLACVLPWLAAAALGWSLRHSYRSRAAVLSYYDRVTLAQAEHQAFWCAQPRFGPYQPLVEAADEQLARLQMELNESGVLAEPLRCAALSECSFFQVITLRCWKRARAAYSQWQQVRHLAELLGDATTTLEALAALRQKVLDIPSDMRAQLALRRYELDQLSACLEQERSAGTVGLEAFSSGISVLRAQADKLQNELDAEGGIAPAVLERAAEPNAALAGGIAHLAEDLDALTALRRAAEDALLQAEETLARLQERWRAVQRRNFREQDIDEVLLGLTASRDDLKTRLGQRTRDAYRTVNAQAAAFDERAALLTEDLAGLEGSIAAVDAELNTAADVVNAAGAAVDELQQRYINIHADFTRAVLDEAAAALAAASDIRQQATRSALAHCQEQCGQVRQQAAEVHERLASIEERAQAVDALWSALKRGDISPYRRQLQFAAEKLEAYPKHMPAVAELLRNIELSQREAELALSCLPADFTRDGLFIETQLDDIYDALQYAERGTEYVRTGIARLRELLEQIEQQRLQVEQDVALLLYVDLPVVEQLSGSMLVELREKLVKLAIEIRQEAAKLLDPSQTEYDQALRFGLPYLKRQLEEVSTAHATHLKQLQLQYEDERRQLARSWAQLDRLDISNLAVVQPLVLKIKADYADWQQTAEGNRENAYILSQTLGRRSADLEQRMVELHRDIVEGRLALKELDKAYQQRYAQAEALRDRLQEISAASFWPNLSWNIDAERAWAQVTELQRGIQSADSLPALLDAWQRTLGACTELVKLYERGESQSRDALGLLQNELKAVNALKQRVQRQAEELTHKGEHAESRKLTKLVAQTEHLIALSRKETGFDAALRYLRQAREKLLRL
ncbi:MAG: hypothetical protein LLG44_08490 [Chloroflexi bacterium]|nr:hypothetical protein [Chloroflexota bacterium]